VLSFYLLDKFIAKMQCGQAGVKADIRQFNEFPSGNGPFSDELRSPRIFRLRRTLCTPRRKPLCGLAHRKNCSFPNWKRISAVLL